MKTKTAVKKAMRPVFSHWLSRQDKHGPLQFLIKLVAQAVSDGKWPDGLGSPYTRLQEVVQAQALAMGEFPDDYLKTLSMAWDGYHEFIVARQNITVRFKEILALRRVEIHNPRRPMMVIDLSRDEVLINELVSAIIECEYKCGVLTKVR